MYLDHELSSKQKHKESNTQKNTAPHKCKLILKAQSVSEKMFNVSVCSGI